MGFDNVLNYMFKNCKVCGEHMPHSDGMLRLDTSEGVHEIEVCKECLRFFEGTAQIMLGEREDDDS